MVTVQEQYERFPYPAVPFVALPQRETGEALQFETGMRLLNHVNETNLHVSHKGKRILVAGCGTLEALVVAQQHPEAKEVVAVDLSSQSILSAKRRCALARLRNGATFFLPGRRLPKIRFIQADLYNWEEGQFDYVVASNVLHHVPTPDALLARLASWIPMGGLLRLMTYPRHSRLWMRLTSAYLHGQGLRIDTPKLKKKTIQVMNALPLENPLRSNFDNYMENNSVTGLVDAFFHQCENPYSPLQWKVAAEQAGLSWVTEAQSPSSRSDFLKEILPGTIENPAWMNLQIMDDLMELCANPIVWLVKRPAKELGKPLWDKIKGFYPPIKQDLFSLSELESEIHRQLHAGLNRAGVLLNFNGITKNEAFHSLKENVGPHYKNDKQETRLFGLSLSEYNEEVLGL